MCNQYATRAYSVSREVAAGTYVLLPTSSEQCREGESTIQTNRVNYRLRGNLGDGFDTDEMESEQIEERRSKRHKKDAC